MFERLHFLIVYVGSAALAAFLAACLSSPPLGTFSCHASGANGAQRCEVLTNLTAGAPETGAGDRVIVPEITNSTLGTAAFPGQ